MHTISIYFYKRLKYIFYLSKNFLFLEKFFEFPNYSFHARTPSWANSSDLLRPLPLDTRSSWRKWTDSSARRFSAFRFLGGPGCQKSLSDAFRRIIFFFVPSWRPPSHSRCPALTIFAISRHPIFSLLRTPGLLSRLARGHYLIFRLETSHPQEKRSDRGKKADRESPLAVHAEDQRCLRVITFVSASVFLSSRRYQAQSEIFEAISLPWLDG